VSLVECPVRYDRGALRTLRSRPTGPTRSLGLALLTLASGLSCGRDSGERTLPVDLFRRLEGAPAILLSVDDPQLGRAASEARDRLVEAGWSMRLATGADDEHDLPRIRVGGFDAEWAQSLAELLGWTVADRQLSLLGRQFRLKESLLVATVPDPQRAGLPLTVVLGSRPEALAFGLGRVLPGWRASARVWEAGDIKLEVALAPSGRPRLDQVTDLDPPWNAQSRRYRDVSDDQTAIKGRAAPGVPTERAREIVASLGRVHGRVGEWTAGSTTRLPLTRVVFEPTVDRLSGYPVANSVAFGEFWPGRVLALATDALPDDSGAAAARLWLTGAWGAPAHTWIAEGSAYERADHYWGRELEAWGAHLLAGELVPSVATLVKPELARDCSVHQRAPLRALLVRHLVEAEGLEHVKSLWLGDTDLALSPELEASFLAFLEQRLARALPDAAQVAARRVVPRMRGAAFTNTLDPQTRAGAGWGSSVARESLRQLARLGANAISLPCFYAEYSDGGDGRPFASANAAGALDGDAAVALAVAHARQEKLRVMLMPEYLARPSGTWRADLKHLRPEIWSDFFDRYERCVTHYGLLAELLDVDVLSVGAGMLSATRRAIAADAEIPLDDAGEPTLAAQNDAIKGEGWTQVIRTARAAYGGALTYSARWPAQVPNIDFWDQLDYVGATLYPALDLPLDPSSDTSLQRQLTTQVWLVRRAANELKLPAIVTEIGFRSTARALNGEMDAGGALDQARQGELLDWLGQGLSGLASSDRAPHGLFLWEWSCDSSVGGAYARGYSPRGKAAEASLGALFE
jgi:hypothetical protein